MMSSHIENNSQTIVEEIKISLIIYSSFTNIFRIRFFIGIVYNFFLLEVDTNAVLEVVCNIYVLKFFV